MGLPRKIPNTKAQSASGSQSNDDKRVVLNRYRVEKKLGSGNFGTAYLVADLKAVDSEDQLKVLKQIPCGDLQPDETVDAMHEAKLLSKLSHEGIVKFHDSFIDGESFCIVTEYCEGGDLDEYVTKMKKRGQTIPEKQVMNWAVQLLMAVHYMHCRRVLHRDLKARNIFLRQGKIKIGDFGISRILMGTADMASTFVGTPYYMSPEVLKHEGYNSKSDVWSIGCILFELCCQHHAFEGQGLMGVMFKIVEGDCPKIGDKYSTQLQTLLSKIFTKDADSRPAASQLLQDPFVANHAKKMEMAPDSDYLLAEQEAQAIELTLQKKYHRKDLEKNDGMTPRERLRLKKQQEADRQAKLLAAASRMNLESNIHRKQHISDVKRQRDPAPWDGRREKSFALPEDSVSQPTFRPKTSPQVFRPQADVNSDNDDDDDITYPSSNTLYTRTVASIPHRQEHVANTTYTLKARPQHPLSRTLNTDNRPITPMKNRMVYDVRHSTLDFKDGIPDDAQLAETYYSQFEDEFDQEANSSDKGSDQEEDEEDELEGTVVKRYGNGAGDISDDENEGTLLTDEAAYARHLEELITAAPGADKTGAAHDFNEDTVALADDAQAGAFGPAARNTKIKNLRRQCAERLGPETFDKVYSYLKAARYSDDSATSTIDESSIRLRLREITTNDSDCFLVDQLLFLEYQADCQGQF